jgi:hypothetical protein
LCGYEAERDTPEWPPKKKQLTDKGVFFLFFIFCTGAWRIQNTQGFSSFQEFRSTPGTGLLEHLSMVRKKQQAHIDLGRTTAMR